MSEVEELKARIAKLEDALRFKLEEVRGAERLTVEQWAMYASFWEAMACKWYTPRYECLVQKLPATTEEMNREHSEARYCSECYGAAIRSAREGWESALLKDRKAA